MALKRDPNTGDPLYDVELVSESGGQFIVEDLKEADAMWLLNAVVSEDSDPEFWPGPYVTGDLDLAASGGTAISFDGERVIFALVRI